MTVTAVTFDTWDRTTALGHFFPAVDSTLPVRFRGETTHVAATIHRAPAVTVHHIHTSSGIGATFDSNLPGDCYLFLISLVATIELHSKRHGILRATPGEGLAVRLRELGSLAISRDSECLATSILAQALHSKLARTASLTVKHIDFSPRFRTDSSVGAMFLSLLKSFQAGASNDVPPFQASRTLSLLQRAIQSLVLDAFDHSHSGWYRRFAAGELPRPVKDAVEFIRERATSDITLDEISKASGVSPRRLQLAFNRYFATTPMAYMRQIRLMGAREELLSPTPQTTVTSVALKWRFPHLGSFSAQYANAFGELPSESLRLNRTAVLPVLEDEDITSKT